MARCSECGIDLREDESVCPLCGGARESEIHQEHDCEGDCQSCTEACGHEDCDGTCDVGLWPTDDEGNPDKPVLLTTVMGNQVDYEITVSMLQAYGIPTVKDFPHTGQLAKLVLGFSGTGMDVYVPVSMLEFAKELLKPVSEDDV